MGALLTAKPGGWEAEDKVAGWWLSWDIAPAPAHPLNPGCAGCSRGTAERAGTRRERMLLGALHCI